MRTRLTILGFAMLSAGAARATGPTRFSLVALQNTALVTGDGVTAPSRPSYGGAVLAELPQGPGFLDLGLLYLPRAWDPSSAFTSLQASVGYGIWFGRYLGIGAGGYFSRAISDLEINGATYTFEGANFASTDYGAYGTVKLNLPLEGGFAHLQFDARYNYGLSNLSTATGTETKLREVLFLFGIRLGSLGAASGSKSSDD